MTYSEAKSKLAAYGQEQVLRYYDKLSDTDRMALLTQIEKTDLTFLGEACTLDEGRGEIVPIEAMQLPEITGKLEEFTATGLDAIRAGKVVAVLLAGGMGTRLGSDKPKGMFNIGLTKPLYIFECLINNLMRVVRQSGAWIHLYVMTSEKNDADTRAFFAEKNYFGYNGEYVTFFKQKMAPATDRDGKIYLESPCSMALSPNGNGGWFASMNDCGLIADLDRDGIEWLNVFAVDNVLQSIADPAFVGAVISRGCEAGAKVIRKNAPDEKVGVMCLEDGKPSIVEYYELTDDMVLAKDKDGEPAYNFGVILNYLFRKDSLKEILARRLPLHKVEKKIPHIDEKGDFISTESPNGYKYENLVLDMIHMLNNCLPFEVVREREFAPIKNREGRDSVVSARELLKLNGTEL